MNPIPARSAAAAGAASMLTDLQHRLARALVAVTGGAPFEPVTWLRDGGRHGGGTRLVAPPGGPFDRASVNLSQVHYDDLPDRRLASATALSAIVHPDNPHGPSLHTHVSLTELRDGPATWRLMADLNPSNPEPGHAERFLALLREVAPEHFAHAVAQGDRYFTIPALGRTRGVAHFYLEGHRSQDPDADAELARAFGERVIDGYAALLGDALAAHPEPEVGARARQLAYHTLYFFQVLTLDRGTTSGLLVHDQNDVGILGSLPSHVDRGLLASWAALVPPPQQELVSSLVEALPPMSPAPVDAAVKARLASVVRAHYQRHPEALALQARGDVLPPTVANHGDG